MRYLIGPASIALALAAGAAAPAAGEELCGEAFISLPGLEAMIKAKPGIAVLPSDGTVVSYSDGAANIIWNFATVSNPAYPSVACRQLVETDGAFHVETSISCGADKAACDTLSASYNELDRRMKEAVDSGR